MKDLGKRILTTHVGSLVRPAALLEMVIDSAAGNSVDERAFDALVASGVKDVVAKQAQVGIDVPSDGEFPKPDFSSYITKRLGGIEERQTAPASDGLYYPKLAGEFPGFGLSYSESLDYLRRTDRLSLEEKRMVLGGAAKRLLKLPPISKDWKPTSMRT